MSPIRTARLARLLAAGVLTASLAVGITVSAFPGADDLWQGTVVFTTGTTTKTVVTTGNQSTLVGLAMVPEGETAPSLQSCPGDTAAGFQAGAYIVPAAVDPATLTYTGQQPSGGGHYLVNNVGSTIGLKGVGTGTGDINVSDFQNISLEFTTAIKGIPTAGDYWLVMACTVTNQQLTRVTDIYWASQMTVTSTGTGTYTWVISPPEAAATTTTVAAATTTTTTTVGGGSGTATTTTVGSGATTTTVDGGDSGTTTTNPADSGSTTTTPGSGATGTTLLGSGGNFVNTTGGFTPTGGGSQILANTGSSDTRTVGFALWGIVILALGRIAVLSARRVRVLPDRIS